MLSRILAVILLASPCWSAGNGNTLEIPTLRAQELLLRSQPRQVRPVERLSLLSEPLRPHSREWSQATAAIWRFTLLPSIRSSGPCGMGDMRLAMFSGGGGAFRLVVDRQGRNLLDPAETSSILLASTVRLSGLRTRTAEAGVGVPYVFCYFQGSPFLKTQPGISRAGISVPVTALLVFDQGEARLSFINRLNENSAEVDGQKRTLAAADFSAAIAQTLTRTPNRPFDIPGLLFTRHFLPAAGSSSSSSTIRIASLSSSFTACFPGPSLDPGAQWPHGRSADSQALSVWFFFYPTGLPIGSRRCSCAATSTTTMRNWRKTGGNQISIASFSSATAWAGSSPA